MADLEAVTAWRWFAVERARVEPAPVTELDPSQEAAARRASDRSNIIINGDTWARQWLAARHHGGLARGTI